MSNETVKQDAMVKMASEQMIPQNIGSEIATTAAAAETAAMIQARYIMALKMPRIIDQVRQDLLKECSRPSFALVDENGQSSALYRKPVGSKFNEATKRWEQSFVEGLGIRFAEVAMRCMKNMMSESFIVQENETVRVIRVIVIDLESNISHAKTITLAKTVERKKPRQGAQIIGSRTNTQGEVTYTVIATEDELATKEAAQVSKAVRTLILRMVPGDMLDECEQKIREVRAKGIKDDPDAAKKKIIDGMALQNVTVTMLEEFLQHPVAQCTPQEILNLQALWSAMRDGETTWSEIMENIDESKKKTKEPQPPASDKGNEAAKARAASADKQPEQKPAETKAAPAEQKPAEAKVEQKPTETKPAAPPAEKPKATPKPEPEQKKAAEPKPWEKKRVATPPASAATTTKPAQGSLEEQVADMAKDKAKVEETAVPTKSRHKPKQAVINEIPMPAYADVAGPDATITDDQKEEMVELMDELLTLSQADTQGEPAIKWLNDTVDAWIGLPLDNINEDTATALTKVLNFRIERIKNKK